MVVVGYVTIVLRVKNPYSMPIFKIAFFGASCSSAASSSDLDRSLQGVYGGFLKWGDSRLTMDFRLLKWSNDLDDLGVTTPQIFVYKYRISKCKHCWENNRVYEYRCKNVNVQVYDYIHNSADVCKYYIYIVYIYICVYIYTDSTRYTCLSKRKMLEMSIGSMDSYQIPKGGNQERYWNHPWHLTHDLGPWGFSST